MTQKFYFHDSLSPNTGILPGLTGLWPGTLASTAPGAAVNRHMDGIRGSTQASVFTNINSGSSGVSWSRRFLSLPLAAKNVPSGHWYLQLAGFVNSLSDQPTLALSISLWRPSTGVVILQNFTTPSSAVALITSPTVVNGPIASDIIANAFSIQDGDIIVVEVLASAGAIATVINTIQYDGLYEGNAQSEASFVLAPCDLPLLQPPPSGPYAISQETGDRLALETDSTQGVLITESAISEFHSFLLEEDNSNFQLEDGTGVLLGENQLFYAIDIEGAISDRVLLEDGTGVLISEEQETIGAIFRNVKLEDPLATIALVGSYGTKVEATGNSISPAFPQTPTVGNLLTAQVSLGGAAGAAVTSITCSDASWSRAGEAVGSAHGSARAAIFYKIATASESAPTFSTTNNASGQMMAQLAEFSGALGIVDRSVGVSGGAGAGSTPLIATAAGIDAVAGELVMTASSWDGELNNAFTSTTTYGSNATRITTATHASPSTHISQFDYAITTGNGISDTDTATWTSGGQTVDDSALILVSFKRGFTAGTDRILLEDGSSFLISEEPTPSFGSAVFVVAADTINAISDSAIRSAQAFSRTASDSIAGLSDAATRLVAFIRTASDSLGAISEATTIARGAARTATDSLGAISDSATRTAQSFTRTASDTVNALSDSTSRLLNLPRIASDTLNAISEATVTAKGVTRTAADTIGAISDSAVRSAQSLSRTASDTINALSDNAVRNAQSFVRTAADSISALSDSAVRSATNRVRTASDSLGALSDSAIRSAQSFARTASDSLNALSDTTTRLTTASRTAADTLAAITEATVIARGIARTAADSLSAISDSAVRAVTARARTADDVLNTLSDSVIRNAQNFLRTASDSLAAITESTVVQKGILRTASDTLSAISDSAVRAVSSKTRTASDSLNALSDTAVRSAQSFVRTAVDSLSAITESSTIARGVSRTASDTISAITDVATRITGRSLTAIDSLSAISDNAVRSAQSFTRTAIDSVGSISDTTSRLTGQLRVASDTISAMTDSAVRAIGRFRTASDSLNAISDSTVRSPQAFARSAVDLLGNLIDAAVSVFSALTRPFQDVDAITYSRDGIGQVYSRDGGIEYSRNGIGETKSRDGGIVGSRDGIGVIKER